MRACSLTGRSDWVTGGSFPSTVERSETLVQLRKARIMIPNDATPTVELTKQTPDAVLVPKGKKVVHYTVSEKVFAANRRNTLRSTGPRTAKGKAASRMNAVKHGILSTEVVVRGLRIQEREDVFRDLRERCWQCLA